MAKKPDYSKVNVAGFDETKVVMMDDKELSEKGVPFQGYGMTPGAFVQIPEIAERVTYKKAMRAGQTPNIPVVKCAEVVKKDDGKFEYTGKVVEIGISSLFQLDADNKPHELDEVSRDYAHYANHKERLDKLAGKVLVGLAESIIKVPRTENSYDSKNVLHVNRIYNDEGKLQVREKKIVPSKVVTNVAWTGAN